MRRSCWRWAATRTPLSRFVVDQFVDVVAYPTPEVLDVEPSFRADRKVVDVAVQAEVPRSFAFACHDEVFAGFDRYAAAGTHVDRGLQCHRHQSLYPMPMQVTRGGSRTPPLPD